MGYLEAFEESFKEDAFISYARIDDDKFGDEQRGWVSQLHDDLNKCVPVHLGAKVDLWRDIEIRDYEDFRKKILNRLPQTATFLFVNSPSFFEREWCKLELAEFYKAAEQKWGVHIDEEKLRIFKIERSRVDRETLPPALKISGSYRFYATDPENPNREYPLRPKFGGSDFRSYYLKVNDLSKDIADVLKAMADMAKGKKSEANAEAPQIAVYLAETCSDMVEAGLELRRDLKCRGYTVLPPLGLSDDLRSFTEEVRGYLQRSVLSIHLVGTEFDLIPAGEPQESRQRIQHNLAMERERGSDFTRVLWLPRSIKVTDPRQLDWIDYLKTDKDVQQHGADMLTGNLEELKSLLNTRLAEFRKRSASRGRRDPDGNPQEPCDARGQAPSKDRRAGSQAEECPVRVYVICDTADCFSAELQQLRHQLLASGCEPVLAAEDEDEKLALEAHVERMNICDAVLIFYGAGNARWFDTKLMDFRKYLNKREHPVLAKAIYIASPPTPAKEALETLEATILRPQGAAPPMLERFLERLKR